MSERTTDRKTIWVFTPSRTDPKDLEFILVQRQKLLKDAVERVRESALADHKHHLLFVGPRGCGKTHLVTLIVNRVSEDNELTDRMRIAWLNEDETCTTFLEFLFKIQSALEKRYPDEYRAEMLSDAYEMKQDVALDFVSTHLLASLDSRTLFVVAENLDALFEGLGDAGQKQLRSFIQENPKFCIVATAQRLVEDLSDRTSPFFGFFQTEHLKPLNVEEATELLQNIARLQEKDSVVEFLATSRGQSRVRAIHHLSGGNHRIYIVLSQFITRDSVDALLEPFVKMVDELTPYYQERIRWLPSMQRKIVEFLCICEGTVPVKEIAKRLFATPQTVSSQLQDLREKGYVDANQRGRESLYEISEPLMRICVEVKDNQRLQPLRLLVDFLRVWYEDHELKNRLGQMEQMEPASASCAYLNSAIQRNSAEGNLRRQILLEDFRLSLPQKLPSELRDGMIQELRDAPEALLLAMQSMSDGKPADAMRCIDEAITEEAAPATKAALLLSRAWLHSSLSEGAKAVDAYTAVIGLPGAPVAQVAKALVNRGIRHGQAGDALRAIDDYTAVIGLPGAPVAQVAKALLNRGIAHGQAGDAPREIDDYTAVIGLPGAPVAQIAKALVYRGITHGQAGDAPREIDDYTAVIGLPGAPVEQVAMALVNRGFRHGQAGDALRAIDDYTAVIGLPGAPVEQVAMALVNRGITHGQAGGAPREIDDYTAVIGLPGAPVEQVAKALLNRGITHGQAGDAPRAIDDYTAVIGLPGAPVAQVAMALVNRGFRHGQAGDALRAIDDYTAVIGLLGAPVEQVATALVNRGFRHGQAGDALRAIDDYTAVIGLLGAPVEQVATALVNRGFRHGQAGDALRAIDDYTAVIGLPGAPVAQVAKALVNRGITHGQAGDTPRAIDDYTAVIGLAGAPVEQVAKALINRGITHGQAGDALRAIDDYTAVIGLPGAPVAQVAMALVNRGVTHGQAGDAIRVIDDCTAVIGLPGAPVEQVATALVNRGFRHGQAGDAPREIDDYTAVIGLSGAPVEQVAMALVNRGVRHGQAGDALRELDDYTAVIGLPGAPVAQVAMALVSRGITHGQAGDALREIDDYTAVIGLPGAPVEQVARALYLRGVTHFQMDRKQESRADFEALIRLREVPVEKAVDAHLALSELNFSDGRWREGFQSLEASLDFGETIQPAYRGTATDLVGVVFAAGLNSEGRRDRVTELLRNYDKHQALSVLGEALVQHVGTIFRSGEPFPSTDNLEGWASVWEQAAERAPDFRLPVRLLRKGIDYVKAGGKDPGILLSLTSPERAILKQALGLADEDTAKAT